MINRNISSILKNSKKSVLLLGPRQVGKSTLIKSLKPDLAINFANQNTFLAHASNPGLIVEEVDNKKPKIVFIDEVQRLTSILNTVQSIVDDNKSVKFYLTGSSARKLKRGRANLLPGRIFDFRLGPFVASEFAYKMKTENILRFGSIPEVHLETDEATKKKLLLSYAGNYLREEIQSEALVRNLESFSRFLAGISSEIGKFIDYSKFSKKVKISRHSCSRYFEVLEDTLIGFRVFPYEGLVGADLVKHPKFYFFDAGIYNGLASNFSLSEERAGFLAEQLIYSQIINSAHSFDKTAQAYTFRTRAGMEVDFIFRIDGVDFGIEVKSTHELFDHDIKALILLKKYIPQIKPYIFHTGQKERKINGIWCLPWQTGLREIGL